MEAEVWILCDPLLLRHRLALNNWGWLPCLVDSEEAVLDKAAATIFGGVGRIP